MDDSTKKRIAANILNHRAELGLLANHLGLTTAIEVGTHQGVFAVEFMHHFEGSLICIDPWDDSSPEENKEFHPSYFQHGKGRETDQAIAKGMLEAIYGSRAMLFKGTLLEYINVYSSSPYISHTVGLIYIDGLHDYKHVWNDITLAWDYISKGGVLAGHDYMSVDDHTKDVRRAVDKFATVVGAKVHTTNDEPVRSWFIRKP